MVDVFDSRHVAPPPDYLLSNGRLTSVLSPTGGGLLVYNGFALTRRKPDLTSEETGILLYIRDIDDGSFWSATLQPVSRPRSDYRFRWDRERALIERSAHGITSVLTIDVPRDRDEEHRFLILCNDSSRTRHIELTTYAEVVLQPFGADAAHPAFSKLFVQTAWRGSDQTLIARRRPRSPDEAFPILYHRLDGPDGQHVDFETDRMAFIGRGRSLRHPRVFDPAVAFARTTGSVLDAILSLRTEVKIEPAARVSFRSILGVASGGSEEPPPRSGVRDADSWQRSEQIREQDAGEGVSYAGEDLTDEFEEAFHASVYPGWKAGNGGTASSGRPTDELREQIGASGRDERPVQSPLDGPPDLLFFNGWGGFSPAGKEYVIRLSAQRGDVPDRPPQPWTHVVANENFGFIVSESGAATTWRGNSRRNRLTPWFNDPVCDPYGESLYLTDEATGASWSPTPGPAPGPGPAEIRYGFGWVSFRSSCEDIDQELVQFVPLSDPVKISRLRLTNRGSSLRRLRLTSYAQLVLGQDVSEEAGYVVTRRAGKESVLLAENPAAGPFSGLVAFSALGISGAPSGPVFSTTDRTAFLGRLGSTHRPAALREPSRMDGRTGSGFDPCFAQSTSFSLAPGATVECLVLLGQTDREDLAVDLAAHFLIGQTVAGALGDVQSFWSDLLGRIQISTPALEIDLMVNGWLLYQSIPCRLWARSAFYQSGGAYGFRDQLQDAAALVYVRPDFTRAQLILHAAHQFTEGDVMHWWHPPDDLGLRTRFSDDLLWLPAVAALYVKTTGDVGLLDESVPYREARTLAPGEDEILVTASLSALTATVYEHCCHAIDRSIAMGVGRNGLPLIGSGDWNDGMNRVGRGGHGESVWLAFFLIDLLDQFADICSQRRDVSRRDRYLTYRESLTEAVNHRAWDGAWYRRAYYDDGSPLGSSTDDECRIDAIAQAWAVLSGAAPSNRAGKALDALERLLVSEEDQLIRLLTPPFDITPRDPGYIKGYVPGVRENGGQYTHGALWAVRAFAHAGRRDRAARYLTMLSPVRHGGSPERVRTYRVEPYVVAADIYGAPPHVGRGGWTWYTGSSSWMWRVAIESIFGITQESGQNLLIKPCIPDVWPEAKTIWTEPDGNSVLEILIRNPSGCSETAIEARIDGSSIAPDVDGIRIPFQGDGLRHFVEILLGRKN